MVLTKEQKKAKKEAKRLEKLKQEEELRKQLKRDELKREIAAQAVRRGALDKSWREMMLKIKEPVFRQDVQVMWHVFERLYDKKDYLITYKISLLNVADDQFQRTVASFCDTIDKMINKFLNDLEAMSKENERRTAALLKSGEDESCNISRDHDAAETHLQLLLYHAHTTADKMAWSVRGENLVKQDDYRSKYENDRENLRSLLESIYNNTWDEYKTVLRSYVLNTAENQKHVRKLRRKENLMADIIASQAKKIANSDGLLKRLRTELAAYESGTKQAAFRERRDRHREACFRLKKNMYDGVATDMLQLANLVKVSDDAVEWLETGFKKLDKILRMASLCRKYETRREKVLPYGSCAPHSPNQAKLSARRQQSDDSIVVNAMSATTGLMRLWHRISKAELTKRALLHEKKILEEENQFLLHRLNNVHEKEMSPVTYECLCNTENQGKTVIKQPVAIDGTAEAKKINLHTGSSHLRSQSLL